MILHMLYEVWLWGAIIHVCILAFLAYIVPDALGNMLTQVADTLNCRKATAATFIALANTICWPITLALVINWIRGGRS